MHPDESLLLAYVRRQPCEGQDEAIQRHLELEACPECRAYCEAYQRIGNVLEVWAHSYPYRVYPGLSDRVMRRAQGAEQSRREKRFSWRILSLPAALLLLLVLSVVIALAHLSAGSHTTGPQVPPGQSTVMPIQPSLTPRSTVDFSMATATSSPLRGVPMIVQCNRDDDAAHSRLRICGTNFTPDSQAHLVLHLMDGREKHLSTIQVSGQGTFEFVFMVVKCKDMPVEIVAQSDTNVGEQSQLLDALQPGTCSDLP